MKKIHAQNRDNNIDLLRIISTFSVILIHVNYCFFQSKAFLSVFSKLYIFESIINTVTRFSVPCFIMISGAYLLNDKRNKNFLYFYKKSLFKIFFPTLIVIIIYIGWDLFIAKENNISGLFLNVITGNYYNLWYMYMLLGIYILVPVVIRYKEGVSVNIYQISAIVLAIWAILSQSNTSYLCGLDLGVVMSYISYFMIGDILYTISRNKSYKKIIVFLVLACILFGITVIIRFMGYRKYIFDAYIGFFSPTIYLASVCVFLVFLNIRLKINLSFISSLTFYIYLFHTIVYRLIFNNFYDLLIKHESISIVCVTILVFFISSIISMIFKFLFERCFELYNGIHKKNREDF